MSYFEENVVERKSTLTRLTLEKKVKQLEIQMRSNSDDALLHEYNNSKNDIENS